jgi:hypothetical protein
VKSAADDLHAELRKRFNQLPVAERLELALQRGNEELEFFRQAKGLDWKTARRILERRQQAGRTFSKCMMEIIEGGDDDSSCR